MWTAAWSEERCQGPEKELWRLGQRGMVGTEKQYCQPDSAGWLSSQCENVSQEESSILLKSIDVKNGEGNWSSGDCWIKGAPFVHLEESRSGQRAKTEENGFWGARRVLRILWVWFEWKTSERRIWRYWCYPCLWSSLTNWASLGRPRQLSEPQFHLFHIYAVKRSENM